MKLYTKKMTYSLLATGLLACAPVDASEDASEDTLTNGDVIQCAAMCRGAFVQEANDKNLTGTIKIKDISYTRGNKRLRNRECKCTYNGDLDIEKNKTISWREVPKRARKKLKKASKHARRADCDQTKEMCF